MSRGRVYVTGPQLTKHSGNYAHHHFTVIAEHPIHVGMISLMKAKAPVGFNDKKEPFMSNIWHLALIMHMERHALGL